MIEIDFPVNVHAGDLVFEIQQSPDLQSWTPCLSLSPANGWVLPDQPGCTASLCGDVLRFQVFESTDRVIHYRMVARFQVPNTPLGAISLPNCTP